eukprot:TRINITY_DN2050_c0_g1_i2.p1 TRINITY_DN2050_c0_g1~~TRINITY_DN2050_c0_g1_i2.p1  ORF type:complete len:253 (-),score=67.64 TRINITY_DN2050_c0_g1_i2:76-834(-)
MINIQTKMSERALEILNFPEEDGPKLILDVGCGTGLSGAVLEKAGHFWIGLDISKNMLEVEKERGSSSGDTLEWDMGDGLSFRPGLFDGVISISALQWLCNADKSWHKPIPRINRFFETLYMSLVRGGKAVFQFYPENPQQMELLTSAALRAGFTGGVLVDFPNSTRAKKYFLVLFAGRVAGQEMPAAVGVEESETVRYDKRRTQRNRKGKGRKGQYKSREWILNKKERMRQQGKKTARDSKYTGRRRKDKF